MKAKWSIVISAVALCAVGHAAEQSAKLLFPGS